MLSAMDDGIGRVLAALKARNLERDTLVFFLSDNGGPPMANGSRTTAAVKGQVFEGGIRVPFVVRWPGTLPEGSVYDEPVVSLDIFPTVAAAATAALPRGTQARRR